MTGVLHNAALGYLRTALNNRQAMFRPGQWEAIEALVARRAQLLVVERTGWGKSSVYFIATRLLREQGAGPTLIVSPLLALMRNQLEAAQRLGVRAETINSTNTLEWPELQAAIRGDEVDALLVSPERLANETFVSKVLLPIANRIGLVVVDEAHRARAEPGTGRSRRSRRAGFRSGSSRCLMVHRGMPNSSNWALFRCRPDTSASRP